MALGKTLMVISFMGLAGLKLFFTAPVVLAANFTFFESVFILAIGGSMGFFVFYFFGGQISLWLSKKIVEFTGKKRDRKRFTRTNRIIVKIKQKTGIIGIAFATPVILSIPIGSMVAYHYYRKNKRTLPAMLLSVFVWSLLSVIFWGTFI